MILTFVSEIVQGAGRGKEIGSPTLNFAIPKDFVLDEGVYACRVKLDGVWRDGVMAYGAARTFGVTVAALEVHVLDVRVEQAPVHAEVEVVGWVRGMRVFGSVEELKGPIVEDIRVARVVLGARQ